MLCVLGGVGGVCKVLKVLNQRRSVMQSNYNTIQRIFFLKEKLKEVNKSDTFPDNEDWLRNSYVFLF